MTDGTFVWSSHGGVPLRSNARDQASSGARQRQTDKQVETHRQTDRQQASRDTGREADGVSWFFFSSGARPLAVARVLVGIHRWAAWLDECCATISERSKGIAMLAAGLPNEPGALLTEF